MRKILNILLVAAFIFVAAPFKNSNARSPSEVESFQCSYGGKVYTQNLENLGTYIATITTAGNFSGFNDENSTSITSFQVPNGFQLRVVCYRLAGVPGAINMYFGLGYDTVATAMDNIVPALTAPLYRAGRTCSAANATSCSIAHEDVAAQDMKDLKFDMNWIVPQNTFPFVDTPAAVGNIQIIFHAFIEVSP